MKVKLFKNTITFTRDGTDVEIVVKSTNKLALAQVEDLLRDIQRDAGILCQHKILEVDVEDDSEY